MMLNPESLLPELVFQTARSGGSGGQNVNKVETKVELRFDVLHSSVLNEQQKQLLLEKWGNRLTNEKVLVLYHQTERSQLANKEKVVAKFRALVEKALTPQVPRKPTKPTWSSKVERLQNKQRHSMVKSLRRKPSLD